MKSGKTFVRKTRSTSSSVISSNESCTVCVRGVVDEDVEAAELRDGLADDSPAVLGIAQVAAHLNGLAAGGLDEPGRLCGVVVLLEIGDGDVRALAREGERDGAADAAVTAGHDGREVFELACASIALLTVVGEQYVI